MSESLRAETPAPGFTGAEGLRALLTRLYEQDSWRTDPDVPGLLGFARSKYARLARKWDRDPDEAVSAAFEVMRGRSARAARDPWALITDAVVKAMKSEAHAEWLMISPARARHPSLIVHERPVRAGEHEEFLYDLAAPEPDDGDDDIGWLSERLTGFLVGLGWPVEVAHACVDYILDRLAQADRRESAYDALRRDITLLAQYELPRASWLTLLRALLGQPSQPDRPYRRGLIARLLVSGSSKQVEVPADDDLLLALNEAAPAGWGR